MHPPIYVYQSSLSKQTQIIQKIGRYCYILSIYSSVQSQMAKQDDYNSMVAISIFPNNLIIVNKSMLRSVGITFARRLQPLWNSPKLGLTMLPRYTFASGKNNKKKDQKEQDAKQKLSIRQSLANAKEIDLESMENGLEAILKASQITLENLKPGKINISIFDSINVKTAGESVPVSSLGQVVATQNQGCIISPYVSETTDDIVKTLQTSQYGFQIERKGGQIVLTLAGANTQEAKNIILKKAKQQYEESKQKLNKDRNKHHEEIKKYKKIAQEDVVRRSEQELQKIYERIVKDLQTSYKNKVKELSK